MAKGPQPAPKHSGPAPKHSGQAPKYSGQATGEDREVQEKLRRTGEIPRHIAIIMDGNGRWAKQRSMPRIAGHSEGVESVRDTVEACGQLGVEYLTLYAFSTENWKRPKEEVSLLMRLLLKALKDETDRLHTNNVRLQTIGEISALPVEVQNELLEDIQKTKDNTGLTLILALSYSGRWDLTRAIKRLVEDAKANKLPEDQISEQLVASYLSTGDIPDPDLLIRTSGEFRISNFLLWQLAYSEIYITPKFWPAFRRDELYAAIRDYQQRERRFGMVSEQIKSNGSKGGTLNRLIKSVTGP
ncbi:MAG: isoprenyl transferase [Ignavibacteriae bacterium]|nr:isoprenyl transferase [Ignavibacteriota bacterium]